MLGKTKDNKYVPLAALRWTFLYTDKDKGIEPKLPSAMEVPQMLYDAVDRLNKLNDKKVPEFQLIKPGK